MTTIINESFHTPTISQQPTTTTANVSQQPGNRNNVEPTENRNPENQARPDCCTQRIKLCCFAINPPQEIQLQDIVPGFQQTICVQRIQALRFAIACKCFD